ncbi:hypothetical protein V5799_022353 [Amblyomma americanum]|uniref:Uncharacterized protein n=1 Tax=Amblyomma americanum TaxID=6943 RepID=A0AAQ4FL41_AMBAM
MQQQQQRANPAGDRSLSPMYLPEVDTDDAVKIWCSRSQPSQYIFTGQLKSSFRCCVTMPARQMKSCPDGECFRNASAFRTGSHSCIIPPSAADDAGRPECVAGGGAGALKFERQRLRAGRGGGREEEEEEGTTTGGSTESTTTSSSSSTSTIPSGMLRQWRRIRKCYADNPDVIGEIHVYRVLTYMGHPHWRKCYGASPAGDSPNLTTVLQTTMALRLEDLRQKKLQMEAAWRTMKKGGRPISRVVLEAKRHAVQQLEKELMSLHEESAKVSRKTRSAKRAEVATGETASAAHDVH